MFICLLYTHDSVPSDQGHPALCRALPVPNHNDSYTCLYISTYQYYHYFYY